MIKQLIKLANHLDKKGLTKEADYLDTVISKYAEEQKSEDAGESDEEASDGETVEQAAVKKLNEANGQ